MGKAGFLLVGERGQSSFSPLSELKLYGAVGRYFWCDKDRYFFPLSTYVERTKLMGMTDG
ncbi:hypothetical protein GGD55_006166 [Rhizobium giardinii]|uniref:Uncharacterized protein n=1 Tax=Rhizobium giardinii TaxID=56731 RepID=A0A7W8UHE6_9HYPH|nr:hypothetical protein [Rhizobium giardinii]